MVCVCTWKWWHFSAVQYFIYILNAQDFECQAHKTHKWITIRFYIYKVGSAAWEQDKNELTQLFVVYICSMLIDHKKMLCCARASKISFDSMVRTHMTLYNSLVITYLYTHAQTERGSDGEYFLVYSLTFHYTKQRRISQRLTWW